jgi:hypothetical protein
MKARGLAIASAVLSSIAGCFPPAQDVQCAEDANCNRFSGGLCHTNIETGNRWCKYPALECSSGYRYSDLDVGDGVSAACVAADPYVPPKPAVENGQRADLVLGQEIFTTADNNHGGLSARSLWSPQGVAIDENDRLWISDFQNHRALMWRPAPPTSFAPATLVVGSDTFTTTQATCEGPTAVYNPFGFAARAGKLLITSCGRVMIWNPAPTTNGSAASIVLGQASFTGGSVGNGAADLNDPLGVWTDGTRVAVADTMNSRVLIWTSFPTTNKQPADLVLGQPDFGISGCPRPPSGATMCFPRAVYSDGLRLFVADTQNDRVLVWRSFPTRNGQPADFAIGQPDLTSQAYGLGPLMLREPWDVTTVGDHLFVVDSGNGRVLEFSPIPTESGSSAVSVLGKPNFETNSYGASSQTYFNFPRRLVVGGNKLYVTDSGSNRVLRFDLKL